MAREPIDYWEKRSTELMKRLEKGPENTINSLIKAYEQATKDINREITKIFQNYAKDTGLTKKTLQQLLTKKESEVYYKNLLEVINNNIADENIKKKLLAKYNAPAYSYRISRYEALQQNIDVELKKLANIEQQITEIRYIDTIQEGYYHTIFDIQNGTGIGFSFSQLDKKTINLLLHENWIDNANFSQRIWDNSEKLGEYLKTQLTADSMSGKSIQKIAKELSEYMNVGLYNATRLVRTEVNHFANEAEMLSYEELEIEKYRFIATLDNRTCEHCAALDNRVFKVKERKPSKNYPPIHANDRCTTVAEFDDDVLDGLQRRARDKNGKPILVSQDMNYKDWYNKYVTNSDNILQNDKNSANIEKIREKEEKELHYIGKIDKTKLGEYGRKIVTDDVVLTDERKLHILEDHEKDYETIINNIDRVVLNPREVLEDSKNKDTLFLIDKLEKHNLNVVVRLNTTNNKKHPQNSVMTAWIIRDKNLRKLREKNKIIYKKE